MKILLFLSILFLSFPQKAQAYLDPGTGSFIIQILVGGGLGLVFLIKKYWALILGFFSKKTKNKVNEKETSDKEHQD